MIVFLPCPGGVFLDTKRAGRPWFPGQALGWGQGGTCGTRHSLNPLANAAEGASEEHQMSIQDNSSKTIDDLIYWSLTSAAEAVIL